MYQRPKDKFITVSGRYDLENCILSVWDAATGKRLSVYECRKDAEDEKIDYYEMVDLIVIDDDKIAVTAILSHMDFGSPAAMIYHVHDDGKLEYWYTDHTNFSDVSMESQPPSSLMSRGRKLSWETFGGGMCGMSGTHANVARRLGIIPGPEKITISVGSVHQKGRVMPSASSARNGITVDVERPDTYVVGENTLLFRGEGISGDKKVAVCRLDSKTSRLLPKSINYFFYVDLSTRFLAAHAWNEDYYVVVLLDGTVAIMPLCLGDSSTVVPCAKFQLEGGQYLPANHGNGSSRIKFIQLDDDNKEDSNNPLLIEDMITKKMYSLSLVTNDDGNSNFVFQKLPFSSWLNVVSRQNCPKYRKHLGFITKKENKLLLHTAQNVVEMNLDEKTIGKQPTVIGVTQDHCFFSTSDGEPLIYSRSSKSLVTTEFPIEKYNTPGIFLYPSSTQCKKFSAMSTKLLNELNNIFPHVLATLILAYVID